MKFEIRKNSSWQERPCLEAVRETKPCIDVRSVDSPCKIWETEEEVHKNWFEKGTNHRIENNKIKRDLKEEVYWTIEMNSLEELLELQEQHGELSISDLSFATTLKLIELKDL